MNLTRPALVATVIIALMLACAAWGAVNLPEAAIPVHWGMDGQPNAWARPAWMALLIVPAIAVCVSLLLAFVAQFTPPRAGPQRSPAAFSALWVAVMLVLAGFQIATLTYALHPATPMVRLIAALIGGLFVVIGNFAGKIRHNFVIGLRTPWTLANERVWDKTHRLYGWLMVLAGAVLVAVAFLVQPVAALMPVIVAVALTPALLAVAYSMAISGRGDRQA